MKNAALLSLFSYRPERPTSRRDADTALERCKRLMQLVGEPMTPRQMADELKLQPCVVNGAISRAISRADPQIKQTAITKPSGNLAAAYMYVR